jgi:hypothetical protein
MATLIGKVKGLREVTGTYKDGKRAGEEWNFLSIDIMDEDSDLIWNCQYNDTNQDYMQVASMDLIGHVVEVTVLGQSASEYVTRAGEKKMQIRSRIKDIKDLGLAKKSHRAA